MALLKTLIVLSLLGMVLGELGRYLLPSIYTVPVVINDVLIGITVGYWLFYKVTHSERIEGKLVFPIVLFFLACVLSLLVNSGVYSLPQAMIASLYLLRWVMYAGLYFVVKDFSSSFKQKLIFLLLGIGQVIVGIGYIQYFSYPSLRNLYYLGWDEHLYRMFSVFLDPNFAGVFFVLVFLLTFGMGLQQYQKKQYLLFSILFLFSFFDIIAVYLTYSRSAFFMLLVSIFYFLWFYGKKRYIAAVFIVLLVLLFISPKSFQTEGTNIFRIASSEARVESAQTAIEIAQKNPVFGVGFNAYRYAQNRYGYLTDSVWQETHAGAGTDNSYLFVLATTGIVGISAYLFLLTRMVKLARSKKDILHVVVISSLMGIFVSSLFINSLFYIFIMEWLWIMLGVTENNSL
ncbi:MAG: O-antigen ligase family protein [Candidatus Levybacteria bacterium]|nr:O-antigen ligase family protein [Candidatus Levybacteria bacterium]